MRRTILISLSAIGLIFVLFLVISDVSSNEDVLVTPTSYTVTSLFSKEADETFVLSLVDGTDLNSGITIERATPASPDQVNNITFAVFNHTDEEIIFPDQGFGIAVFSYDENNHHWERLQLPSAPYSEVKTLPPKLETWDFEVNNTWGLLDYDTTTFGEERLRLYVSGKGKRTNQIYGAHLDVSISSAP